MIINESLSEDKYIKYVIDHRSRVKRAWETYLKPRIRDEDLKSKVDYLIEIHDMDKFEDLHCRSIHYNYGRTLNLSIETPEDSDFDKVSQLHKESNGHHWNYWIVEGQAEEIPEEYVLEMLADWASFQFVKNSKGNAHSWWDSNKDEIEIHPNTRKLIDHYMKLIPAL